MDEKQLMKIGLLESEGKVYLALIKMGQSSAGKIAKETRLNRVSVYKGLQNLMNRGLVLYVIKANRKEYSAINPQIIEKIIQEKQEELEEIKKQIPSIQQLFTSTKRGVEVQIYEGIKGAKAIWETLLEECKENDEWLILGAPKSAEILGGYFDDFNRRRTKKRISMKIVYNQKAEELIKIRSKQLLTSVKVMPEEYITPVSLEIINDHVLIVMYEPQMIIFHIKNKMASQSFRIYFELLWKIAKKR